MASNAAATSAGSNRSNSGLSSASSASTAPSATSRSISAPSVSMRSRARSAEDGSGTGASGAARERMYGSCAAVTSSTGSPGRAGVALEEIAQRRGIPAEHDATRLMRLGEQRVERGRVLARREGLGPRDDDGGDGVQLERGARQQRGEVLHCTGEQGDGPLFEEVRGSGEAGDGVDAHARWSRRRPVHHLETSATIAISQEAKRRKAAGEDVIDLGAGEPDFPTPSIPADAGVRAIREGKTHYAANEGILELRAAAAQQLSLLSGGRPVNADHIVISNGSKQSLFNVCFSVFGPGDVVAIPAPAWVSYPQIVHLTRARPILVPDDLLERVVIIYGVSKAYAMTGWRIGIALAPPKVAKAMAALQSHTTTGANHPAQWAAAAALADERVEQDVARMVAEFRKRRELVVSRFRQDLPGVEFVDPLGAFYFFFR